MTGHLDPEITLRWQAISGAWREAHFGPDSTTEPPGAAGAEVVFDPERLRYDMEAGEHRLWVSMLSEGRCPTCAKPLGRASDVADRQEWAVCPGGGRLWRLQGVAEPAALGGRDASAERGRPSWRAGSRLAGSAPFRAPPQPAAANRMTCVRVVRRGASRGADAEARMPC